MMKTSKDLTYREVMLSTQYCKNFSVDNILSQTGCSENGFTMFVSALKYIVSSILLFFKYRSKILSLFFTGLKANASSFSLLPLSLF